MNSGSDAKSRALPHLVTDRMVLRLAAREDVKALVEYFVRTREAFRSTSSTRPAEYFTENYWIERVAHSTQDFLRDQSARFFLFTHQALPIGSVGFNQIVRGPLQACTLGYALDPAEQGKGLMHEALSALIPYAFEELGLHRVMAGYMPHNTRSAAVLRRLGFEIEGKARDYIHIDGQWRDHVLTSLINPTWRDPARRV